MRAKKITAYILLTIFSAAEALSFSPHLYAQEISSIAPAAYSVERLFQQDISKEFVRTGIPASIEETYQGSDAGTVILIQDAHAVSDAQKAIRSLVLYLTQNYGIHFVGVEGASEQLDATIFKAYPNHEAVEDLFEDYLSQAEISGAAAAAVFSDKAVLFSGVENSDLYEAQINAFLASLKPAAEYRKKIEGLTQQLDLLKKKHYSTFLYVFDQHAQTFLTQKSNLAEFVRYLLQTKIARPDAIRYPHLAALFAEFGEHDYVTRAQVDRELKQIYKTTLKIHTDRQTLQQLHAQNQAYQTEHVSAGAFAEFLIRQNEQAPVVLSETLRQLVRQYRVLKEADGKELMHEFENFIASVKNDLIKTEDQKTLDRISAQLDLAGRFLDLKLVREEQQALQIPLWKKKAIEDDVDRLAAASSDFWEKILTEENIFTSFYDLAVKREQAMIENTLKKMSDQGTDKAVLVTGGFHTDGLKETLRQRGISYIVMTPKIENMQEENHYIDFMKGEVSWRDYFEEKNGRIRQYDAFVRSARDKLLGDSVERRAVTLKTWRDQLIRELARENRITAVKDYVPFIDESAEKQKKERVAELKKEWLLKVNELVKNIRFLHQQNNLTVDALSRLAGGATAVEWTASPFERNRTFPVAWMSGRPVSDFRPVRATGRRKASFSLRTELRSIFPQTYEIDRDQVIAQNIYARKTGGILTGIFQLRRADTEWDLGSGDLKAVEDLIDWSAEHDVTAIELLPPHETGPSNNWPYSAQSAFALSLTLADVGSMEDVLNSGEAMEYLSKTRAADIETYRGAAEMPYAKVWELKHQIFRRAYQQFKQTITDGSVDVERLEDFKRFQEEESEWLNDWALYFAVQQRQAYFYPGTDSPQWASFRKRITEYPDAKWFEKNWTDEEEEFVNNYVKTEIEVRGGMTPDGQEAAKEAAREQFRRTQGDYAGLAQRDPQAVREWTERLQDVDGFNEIEFVKYTQWILFRQWEKMKKRAEEKNVNLIGDMPMYLDHKSADVWVDQEDMDFDILSGVGPDPYSDEGQFWRQPTYKWDRMKARQMRWWRARIRMAKKLYHGSRDDHSAGKDEPWGIPKEAPAAKVEHGAHLMEGPKDVFFQTLLAEVVDSNFFVFAEDLGSTAEEVEPFLKRAGLMTYRYMFFGLTTDASEAADHARQRYADPGRYPQNSITLTGTHDSPTFSHLWHDLYYGVRRDDGSWKKEPHRQLIQLLLDTLYPGEGKNADDFPELDDETNHRFIDKTLSAKSRLAIVPLHDVFKLPKEFEVNGQPGEVSAWSVRFNFVLAGGSNVRYEDEGQARRAEAFKQSLLRAKRSIANQPSAEDPLILGTAPVIDEDTWYENQAEQWRRPGEPFTIWAVAKKDAKRVEVIIPGRDRDGVQSNVEVSDAFMEGEMTAVVPMQPIKELPDGTVLYGVKFSIGEESSQRFTLRATDQDIPNEDQWQWASPGPHRDAKLIVTNHAMPLTSGRTELRRGNSDWVSENTPELLDYTVITRQMEQGIHRGIIEKLRANPKALKYVPQLTLTGGLGALQHDAVEAWGANYGGYSGEGPANLISILPLFELIKAQGITALGIDENEELGDLFAEALEPTGITKTIRLNTDGEFAEIARRFGSKAAEIIGQDLEVTYYQTFTHFSKTPTYYMDIHYTNPEGQRVRLFDAIYPDEKYYHQGAELKLWRDVHMAAYNLASQILAKELQEQEKIKDKLIFVENEGFVSLPLQMFPDAIRDHRNHTVFRHGLPKSHRVSYNLLGYPDYLRPEIVNPDGSVDMIEAIALDADFITGVGLAEHHGVLHDSIFPAHRQKLWQYNQDGLRNTNGAYMPQWQADERRALLEYYRALFNLDPKERDEHIYNALELNPEQKEKFKRQQENVNAAYVGELLMWLADEQQPDALWLRDTMKKYQIALGGSEDGSPEALDAFREKLQQFKQKVEQVSQNPAEWTGEWAENEWNILREVLMADPIVSNIRRQVAYKGPEKWHEIFEFLENPDHADAAKWLRILELLGQDKEALKFFRENAPRVILGGRLFHQGKPGVPQEGGRELFEKMKGMIKALQLEDRVTFVEDYTIENAELIFKAVAGTVMLSDEFLEASATSMMKALTNFGALIIVWGGAGPELLTIKEVETGREIDIFKENVTHDQVYKNTHATLFKEASNEEVSVLDLKPEEVRQRLASGEWVERPPVWQITNGWLAAYAPYSGPGSEQSTQQGGKRRPSAQSLMLALKGLRDTYRDANSRRELQFNIGASSYKVDMEKGQARAQLFLWQRIIRERQKKAEMFAPLREQLQGEQAIASAFKVLSVQGEGFPWQRKPDPKTEAVTTIATSEPGLLGFLQGFRKVRNSLHSIDGEDVRGVEAIWSISHHSLHFDVDEASDYGDIFNYFLKVILRDSGEALQPVKARIRELAQKARASEDMGEKITLTLEAIDLMNDLSLELVRILFEAAVNGNEEAQSLFTQKKDPEFILRRALSEYIEKNSLNRDPSFYEAAPERRQALILENLAKNEEILRAMHGPDNRKPVVRVEQNYPVEVFAGDDIPVYAVADLKSLSLEDVSIDLLYRDVRRDARGQWSAVVMDEQARPLGNGKYALQANLHFSQRGHYEFQVRIRPRNEMFWTQQKTLESATSTVYIDNNRQMSVREHELLEFRAQREDLQEGMLFYTRIPAEKQATRVLWMSQATQWEEAPIEMQKVAGTDDLWAVVVDRQKAQPTHYYEFRMIAQYEDGTQEDITGDYDVTHRGERMNAHIAINENHFFFKAETAAAALTRISENLEARDASASLMQLYFPDIETRGEIEPEQEIDFRNTHVSAELPASLLADADQWRFYVHYGYADDPRTWQTTALTAETAGERIKLSVDLEMIPYEGRLEYKLIAVPGDTDVDVLNEDISEWSPHVIWAGAAGGTNHSFTASSETETGTIGQAEKDRLALAILQAYAQGQPKARNLLKMTDRGKALRTMVADYLIRNSSKPDEPDTDLEIKQFATTYDDILAFAVPYTLLDDRIQTDEKILILINQNGQAETDAEGNIPFKLYPDGAAYILGETAMEDRDVSVTLTDLNHYAAGETANERIGQMTVKEIETKGIPAGIRNLKMIRLQPARASNIISHLLSAAIKGDMYKREPAVVHMKRLITQKLTEGSQDPANVNKRMATMLRPVAKLNKAAAEQMFGKDATPVVMGLVAVLAPEVFRDERESLETWNKNAYTKIFQAVTDSDGNLHKVFSQGTLKIYPTKEHEGIVFSREHAATERRIFFPFHFSADNPNVDGKRSVIIPDYHLLGINFLTADEAEAGEIRKGHSAHDLLLDVDYQTVHTQASLDAAQGIYHFKVPVIPKGWDWHGVPQEGWRFQMIELVPVEVKPGEPVHRHETLMVPIHVSNWSYELEHPKRQTPEGAPELARFVPVDSIHKTTELLTDIAEHGGGIAYVYGGTDKLGEHAVHVHSVQPDGKSHFFSVGDVNGGGRVTVQIEGGYGQGQYKTRHQEFTLPDGRKVILEDDQSNAFSIVFNGDVDDPQPVYNPALSNHRTADGEIILGTPEETEQQIEQMNIKGHELGLKMAGDVIFWLAPEAITKKNYHWTFYKKMEGEWIDAFRALPDDEARQQKINALLDPPDQRRYFTLWFKDDEGLDQVILIKHFEGDVPHKDQVLLNPYVPQVMQYYKNRIKQHIKAGFDIGRVDLAAKLLQGSLKGIMGQARDGLGLTSAAEFEARQIYSELFEYADQLAGEQGIVFTFAMEMYNDDEKKIVRNLARPFENIDVAFYHEKVTQHMLALTRRGGVNVNGLQDAMRRPFDALARHDGVDNPDDPEFLRLISALSNFDNISAKRIGGALLGVMLQQMAVANAGAWVMLDLRDITGIDPLYPIPGGNMRGGTAREANPDNVDGHSAADQADVNLYAEGWDALRERIRDSRGFAAFDHFNQALRRTGESWFTFLNTGDQSAENAVSALAFQEKGSVDWVIIVVDHRYWEQKPREIDLPPMGALKLEPGYRIEAIEVTPGTDKLGETLEIGQPGHIRNLRFSPEEPYKIIRLTAVPVKSELRAQRSELRKAAQHFLQSWARDGRLTFDLIRHPLELDPEAFALELTRQAPRFAGAYASRVLATDGASSDQSVESYMAYQARLNQMIPQSIGQIENQIRRHLDANLENSFHFNAVVPFSSDNEINRWWDNFLNQLDDLKNIYGDRVSANVLMVVEGDDQNAASFLQQTRPEIELIHGQDPQALKKVTTFLDQHENAPAFSLPAKWSRALKRSRQGRLVELSGLDWQEAFPVSAAIGIKAAQIEELTSTQLLRQIPQQFDRGIFGYQDGALVIYETARDLVFNASISEMIATMA